VVTRRVLSPCCWPRQPVRSTRPQQLAYEQRSLGLRRFVSEGPALLAAICGALIKAPVSQCRHA
jgi:hypothetical protein